MLHECRNTCTRLWMRLTVSALKKWKPWNPCCIATWSGQCVEVMWSWTGWGSLQHPISPQLPAWSSLCRVRDPEWWWPRWPVGPETPQTLPWRGGPVPPVIRPGTSSHAAVHFLVQPMMEGRGGGKVLWNLPGKVSPRCGPGGLIGRRTLGGRYCALRRPGHNNILARLQYMHWGSGGLNVAGLTVCWGRTLILIPWWRIGTLKGDGPIPWSIGQPRTALRQLDGGILRF